MKRVLLTVAMLLTLAAPAVAQSLPTDRFSWTVAAATLTQAQTYRYEAQIDTPALFVLAVTCTGATSPFSCSAPIPAVTPAQHTAIVRAVDISIPTQPAVGPWSDPLTFQMRAVPAKPGSLTIVPGS